MFSLFLLLSLLLKTTNPFSLLLFPIYSLRLVGCLWLPSGLTRVGGARSDYSWQGVCFLGNNGNGVELVLASKRLLNSDIPQGNTELPRSRAASSKYNSRPNHTWLAWACLTCDQWNGHTIGFGLKKVLGVCLGQGPRPNGLEVVCRTVVILKS